MGEIEGSINQISDYSVARVRKQRRCAWCGEIIEVGSSAHDRKMRDVGFIRSEIYTESFHLECWDAMMLSMEHHDDDWFYEEMPRGRVTTDTGLFGIPEDEVELINNEISRRREKRFQAYKDSEGAAERPSARQKGLDRR